MVPVPCVDLRSLDQYQVAYGSKTSVPTTRGTNFTLQPYVSGHRKRSIQLARKGTLNRSRSSPTVLTRSS